MKRKIFDGDFLEKLESIALAIKNPMSGYFGGAQKARGYGNTVEFADFREYVPGDDLRRIDWNVYARFQKHFIKLFTDERQMHNRIMIDCSASMGTGKPEKAECALKIAAALGYLSVCAMDRVSFQLMRGDKTEDLCGTILGKSAFYQQALMLEDVDFGGDTLLDKAMYNCPNPGYDDGVTVIISDFLTESSWKNVVDFLTYRHRQVILVQVLSPEEVNPAILGDTHLVDMESQEVGDYRNVRVKLTKKFYKTFRDVLEEYKQELFDYCVSRGGSFISCTSDMPIETIIFEQGSLGEVIV